MVTRREWYERVNATWPEEVPPLTFDEAVRAYRKLYRFVYGKPCPRPKDFRRTSGNRDHHTGRQIRIINPDLGWKSFIHHLSHRWEPSGHNAEHARMERRLIKEVLRRGWLEGKLKTPEKRPSEKPPNVAVVSAKLDHAQKMLMKAETRAKRAGTILKKWQRKVRYYERRAVQP